MGGPSPKSRRVGARGFPERFPGSPQAGLSPHVGFPPQSPLSGGGAAAGSAAAGSAGFNVTCSPLGGSDRTYFPAPAASAKAAALGDPSSGRGHRRSSSSGLSSGWGSGPRHGGVGEGGFDPCATAPSGPSAAAAAAVAAAAAAGSSGAMSAGFQASATAASSSGQSWSVRLGDGAKQSGVATAPKPVPRQHGWVLSSGEVQQQQQQVTKSRSSSPSISANGQPQQRLPQQQSAASRPKSHGVVRRRHSAPIPPVQTFPVASGAGEFAGEDIMGMSSVACSSAIKMEFQAAAGTRQPMEGIGGGSGGGSSGGGDVLESFSTNFFGAATGAGAGAGAAAAGKWGGAAPAPVVTKMETEGAWWQRQAGEGGMLLETSATAASTPATEMPGNGEFETTFDDSAGGDDLMDAHVMTATLPVDL
ncbi:unnamed protein product [Ectocarpus fasciculatus]